jgi:hypothetical protein
MSPQSLPLLAFTVMTSSVIADERMFGNGSLPEFLQQFDTNNDGEIDEEERQAIRDLRAKMRDHQKKSIDLNEDGEVSPDEIEAARDALRIKIEARRLAKFSSIAGEDALISREEYNTIPGIDRLPDFVFEAIWGRLDIDGSDDITAKEFLSRLRSHQ